MMAVGALAVLAAPAVAQHKPTYGILIGGNLGQFTGPGADSLPSGSQESKGGFLLGASASFSLTPRWDLEPELLYIRKGTRLKFDTVFFGQTFSGRFNFTQPYLEVPVLAKLRVGARGGRALSLAFGPYVAQSLSCTGEFVDDNDPSNNDKQDCTDFQETDFGGVLGVGVEFGRFSLSTRYERSFRSLTTTPGDPAIYHRVISIVGGMTFGRR
jgi:hypothetical protein